MIGLNLLTEVLPVCKVDLVTSDLCVKDGALWAVNQTEIMMEQITTTIITSILANITGVKRNV